MGLDSHAIGERFRLLTHLIYGERIDREPILVEDARSIVATKIRTDDHTFADRMWAVLLTMPIGEIRRAMVQQSAEGDILRSGSPFSELIGVEDAKQKSELWRRAKAELDHTRTSNMRSGR